MFLNKNFLCSRTLPAILLVLLVGSIVYSNTFQVPFVLDDQTSIVNNIASKSLDKVFYGYKHGYNFVQNRVVAYLTFALNYQFGGLNVTGYHVVNSLIHLATSLLVYTLLRLTFRTPYYLREAQNSELHVPNSTFYSLFLTPHSFIPLFAALLFVVHPVQTQAVTYIVQRMTSMATMFYLLSMVLYVMARLSFEQPGKATQSTETKRPVWPWLLIAGSTLAAVLAMKTKEIAFTLPPAIVLYEVFFFRGAWKRRLFYLLPILATLPIIPITILDIGGSTGNIISTADEQLRTGNSMSRFDYLFTQFRVIVTYLRLLVLPINQNLDYDYPVYTTFFTPPVFLSFLLLTSVFGLAVYLFFTSRTRITSAGPYADTSQFQYKSQSKSFFRLIAFGIFWFFLTLSVESSLVPIKDIIMEYRLYLPFFGVGTAFAAIFYLLIEKLTGPSSGRLLILCAAILILALGFATYQRNYVWGDAIRLWQDVVDKSPNKARPINNLGNALERAGKRAEAFKAFSKAIKLDPSYYKAYYNLADLYLVSDQPEKALPLLQKAINLNSNFIEAYVSIGAALMRSGRFNEVAIFLEQNLNLVGDKAEARFYLGAAYAFLGKREAAMRELEVLSRLDAAYAANLAGMLGLKANRNIPHGRQ